MNSLTHGDGAAQDVLLYGRNSTDDQAEAGTIENQQHFLRNFAELYRLRILGQYWDEGISGTIPLADRPEGRRLLEAASARPGAAVLAYRLDRLGRSLRVLVDAHDALEASAVTIRSATEPFDTGTAIGKFLFQLLASLAELDRATIIERMDLGRDRVVRGGKWTHGTVPFGYDVDDERRLIPSARVIDQVGAAEADVARGIIERIAEGSTATAEAVRLNALGVPSLRHFGGGRVSPRVSQWSAARIAEMVRRSLYSGTYLYDGRIEMTTPALVDEETRRRASEQLTRNRAMSMVGDAPRRYLLRGLIVCAGCGATYVGVAMGGGSAVRRATPTAWTRYYACGTVDTKISRKNRTCRARRVRAEDLEALVWADCAAFLRDPGAALAAAQRQLRERLSRAAELEAERRRLQAQLAEKESERERVMTLYRRGRATLDETEAQLEAVQVESMALRAGLESIRAQHEIAQTFEQHYADAVALLAELGAKVDAIEASNDWAAKRTVVERLVGRVAVDPNGAGIDGRVQVTYTFGGPRVVPMGSLACLEAHRSR